MNAISEKSSLERQRSVAPFGTYPPNLVHLLARNIGQRLPKTWWGLRVSGWLRSLLRRTTHRPVDMTALGLRLRLNIGDNACERRLMVTPQFFNPAEIAKLRARVRDDFHFIDLGANVGIFSVFVGSLAGPGCRILAIEPQPVLIERLRDNIALNNLNVTVEPVAVSDRDGFADFAVDLHNFGRTSLNLGRTGPRERHTARLPVRTLLGLVREHGFERVDALKVDIEGAEDLALMPFFEQAPRALWPKLIFIENNVSEWRRDCISELVSRGYRRELSSPGNEMLSLADG
jgi:FkbM family methyltransferase